MTRIKWQNGRRQQYTTICTRNYMINWIVLDWSIIVRRRRELYCRAGRWWSGESNNKQTQIYWAEDRSKQKKEGTKKLCNTTKNKREEFNRRIKPNDSWMKSSQCYYFVPPILYMFGIIFYYLNLYTSVEAKLNGVLYYCQTTAAESTMGINMMSRPWGFGRIFTIGSVRGRRVV